MSRGVRLRRCVPAQMDILRRSHWSLIWRKRGHVTFKRSVFMTSAVGLGCKLYANADPLMRLIADLIRGYNCGSLFPTWSRKLWVSCL